MKIPFIFLIITTLLGSTSCAVSPRAGAEAEKSVLAGELLAIFPGLFIHGMGHRYAGNTDRANEIFTMEVTSLLTAGLGGGLWAIGDSEDKEAVEITGFVGMGVGGVVFLGTWIYDLVYTPGEVEEYNRRIRSK